MTLVHLSLSSLWNRRTTAGLTVLGVALSVAMLVGVEKVRREARETFVSTISGTDLIVGARSGAVQLLLYSVFRIGNATNNISWESYQDLTKLPGVEWTVPLSLGDSHRGFRVLGTTRAYFERYRYAAREPLRFAQGKAFEDVFDAVIGAEVARELGYALGDPIVVTHGSGRLDLMAHDDKPFRVTGILERTGTPVDRAVHVSLEGIEAMHVDWSSGVRMPGQGVSAQRARSMNLAPEAVTAVLVGLKSKTAIFRVMRAVNEYRAEPLLAIIPGVALQELWDLVGVAEKALRIVSITVVAAGMLGMLTMILSGLETRRREIAVLRSVGARPAHVFGLFMCEAGLLTLAGSLLGMMGLYSAIAAVQTFAAREFGLHLPISAPQGVDLLLLAAVVVAGFLVGAVPAGRAYRLSLADGLSIRI